MVTEKRGAVLHQRCQIFFVIRGSITQNKDYDLCLN